jgi:23S rRNA (cytosine1962-C5)-methyltransferase
LNELIPCTGIYERSDISSRDKEGLPQRNGVLYGKPPPDLVEINNGRFSFLIDMKRGHKTGFYLDQRDNRRRLGKYVRGTDVLDCFAYTGGFTIAALKGGATHVTCIEDSAQALDLIRRNVALNNLDLSQAELERGDVFQILRRYRDARRKFDLVILDPPKFAASRADIRRAGSGYKDINLLACKLLKPAGILATFSCSQHISLDLFQKTVAYAALDADRDVQILEWLHQSRDHPITLNFPEGNYLKGLICRVW